MANAVTDSLLKAISTTVDQAISELSNDKTVKATIIECIDSSSNKYAASYNGGTIDVYAQDKVSYKTGETVYVLVPMNNFGNKKYIIGKASEGDIVQEGNSISNTSKILSDYSVIGKNANISEASSNLFPLTLSADKVSDWVNCYDSLDNDIPSAEHKRITLDIKNLERNMKNSDALLIRARFITNLSAKARGNYGITMIVNVTLEDGSTASIPYTLDTQKMKGDPMRYYSGMSQQLICDFSKYKFNYIENIFCFSEGFTNRDTSGLGEIKINNLEIYALASFGTNDDSEYVLSLTTPLGNALDNENEKVTVAAKVYSLGIDVTSSATLYWGVEDFTVNTLSVNYNSKLGAGFKYLPAYDNSEAIEITVMNNPGKENKYKCVAVCGEVFLEKTVYIFNDINQHEVSFDVKNVENGIYYPANGNITITCLIDGKKNRFIDIANDNEFTFIWSKDDDYNGRFTFEKSLQQLEEEENAEINAASGVAQSSIKAKYTTLKKRIEGHSFTKGVFGNIIVVPPRDARYYCTVKRNGALLGSAEIDLRSASTSLSQQTYITIKNGNQSFQYNERGVSPASARMKEPVQVLLPSIEFRNPLTGELIEDNNIADYCYWDFPKENTLIVGPTENLSAEGWYHGQTFPLSIAEDYDVSKTNNQLIAIVKWQDNTYRANTNLGFSKIGEIGTNGTSFTAKIVPNFEPENAKAKLAIIQCHINGVKPYWNAKTKTGYLPLEQSEDVPFKSQLYLNNELQSGYGTSWSLHGGWKKEKSDKSGYITPCEGYTYVIESETGRISFNEDNNRSETSDFRTIKAKNTLDGNHYYAYYNVPSIEYFGEKQYSNTPIDIIESETLNYITYNADDSQPSYNDNIGVTIEVDEQLYNSSTFTWTAESGLKTKSGYQNPNFLLSFNKGSSTGGRTISFSNANSVFEDFSKTVNNIAENDETGEALEIQNHLASLFSFGYDAIALAETINKYLITIETKYCPAGNQWTNLNIKDIYEQYKSLVSQIIKEHDSIVLANAELNNCRKNFNSILNGGHWKSLSLFNTDVFSENLQGSISGESGSISTYQRLFDCIKYNANGITDGDTQLSKKDVQEKVFSSLFDDTRFGSVLNGLKRQIDGIDVFIQKYSTYSFVNSFENQKTFYTEAYNQLKSAADNKRTEATNADLNIGDFENIITNLIDKAFSLFVNNSETNYIDTNQISVINNCVTMFEDLIDGETRSRVKLTAYVIPNETFSSAYANNNVKITITNSENEKVAEVTVPICFTTNTYSLSSLNGWDGTGIRINEDEGYILSPQIGAGVKNDVDGNNTFTGIVMGTLSNPDTDGNYISEKIGLMGFSDGRQSIFLDSRTGNATFGLKDGSDTDGCIELIPGGTSKIANWNIGKNLLYNSGTGTLELRNDSDSRIGDSRKSMIPKNDFGILLSSNMPYIHIKGKTFDANYVGNLSRNTDGTDSVNVGDSLELRLDPDNKSLFSIWQHTDGFNAEQDGIDAIRTNYGTYTKSANEKRVTELDLNSKELDSTKVYTTYTLSDESYYTFGNSLIQYDDGNTYDVNPVENSFNFSWTLSPSASIVPTTGRIVVNGCKLLDSDYVNVDYTVSEGYNLVEKNIGSEENPVMRWDGTINGIVSCEPGVSSFKSTVCTILSKEEQEQEAYDGTGKYKIPLYSFTLLSETPTLSINQPIDFSGIMTDSNLSWCFTIDDETGTPIARTNRFYFGEEYDSQLKFEENNFIGVNTFEPATLKMCLELYSDSKKYKYAAEINANINATTGYLPDVDWELKYSDVIGRYTQMYGNDKSIVVPNSNIEFKYTTGYFDEGNGSSYKITNTSGTESFTIVFYSISTTTGNSRVGAISVNTIAPQETIYVPVGAQTNSFYSWRYAVYPAQNENAITERLSVSENPKYTINNIEFKLVNKQQLNISLGEPGNFNNLTPRDYNVLCHYAENVGDIVGYQLAETTVSSDNRPVITIKKSVLNNSGMKTKIPFIDWFKSEDGYTKCVRALKYDEIKSYFETTDADLVLYPRNDDFESKYLAIEEYIKVGIDENGKFFTHGKNDTSSRVGAIKIFNTGYGYGQEISSKNNPILKVASTDDSNDKSTFITPGSNKIIKMVSNKQISLYLPNSGVQSQINPIPTAYTGIEINSNDITVKIKGQEHSFTQTDLVNMGNSLTAQRVYREQNIFDNDIIYQRLTKLLTNATNFNSLINILQNYANIENTVKTGHASTWVDKQESAE